MSKPVLSYLIITKKRPTSVSFEKDVALTIPYDESDIIKTPEINGVRYNDVWMLMSNRIVKAIDTPCAVIRLADYVVLRNTFVSKTSSDEDRFAWKEFLAGAVSSYLMQKMFGENDEIHDVSNL